MNKKHTTSNLLICAGALLLIAGVLMAMTADLIIAVILWAGALCMLLGAYNFRIAEKDREDES